MKTLRSNYEQAWTDIARLIRPVGKGFSATHTEGENRHKGIYDSSPLMALEHFKAGLYGSLTPQSSIWGEVQHMDEDVNEYGPFKEYFRIVTQRTWKSFGPGVSKFYNQVPSVYADIGAFGTGVLYSAEMPGEQRFMDRARALHECWIDINGLDEVDTLFRRYELTVRAIASRKDWDVPVKVTNAAQKTPQQKMWVIHAVYPESDRAPDRYGKKWTECYVLEDGKKILGEASYYEFPYMVPRWDIVAGERYGRGCGHVALADVKSLNIARRSNLNMMDRAARPTILAQKEADVGGGIAPFPGEIVYGAMNADGKRLVAPMEEGKNPGVALEMEERIANSIKDAFYFGLMQIVGSRDMTATEFLGRDDERQRLLGPYLGNIETELLTPLVFRRVKMLERAGQLPPMPQELALMAGGIEVRYVSPLARLQRQRDGEAANKVVASLLGAMQVNPQVGDRLDPDKLAEILADGFGADVINTRQIAQGIRDAREQQQMAMAAAEAAPGVAKGVKDMTEAQQMQREAANAA